MFLKRFPAGWTWPVSGGLLAHDAGDGTQGGGSRELRGALVLGGARRGKGEHPGLRGGKGQAGRVGRFQGGGLSGGAGLWGAGLRGQGGAWAPSSSGGGGGQRGGARVGGLCLPPSTRPVCSRTPAGSCPSLPYPGLWQFQDKGKEVNAAPGLCPGGDGLGVAVKAHLGLVGAWAPRWILGSCDFTPRQGGLGSRWEEGSGWFL